MNTQFMSPSQKGKLIGQLSRADNDACITMFEEIDRLESIIKAYEIALEASHKALENNFNKKPKCNTNPK